MARLIQIGNLPDSVDDIALQWLFQGHGTVRSATVHRHSETGRSTGVGFVEMESEERGAAAVAALNHREYRGCVLSACWLRRPDDPVAEDKQMFGPMNMPIDRT